MSAKKSKTELSTGPELLEFLGKLAEDKSVSDATRARIRAQRERLVERCGATSPLGTLCGLPVDHHGAHQANLPNNPAGGVSWGGDA